MKSNTSPALKAFFLRLNHAKKIALPKPLSAAISARSLHSIIDFITNNTDIHRILKGFPENNAIRFDKKDTKLPRTFGIGRKPDGEYFCILETKSKAASGTKRRIKTVSGAYKRGKDSWRIDVQGQFEPYISLQVLVAKQKKPLERLTKYILEKIALVRDELAFPRSLKNRSGFHESYSGPLYNNRKGLNLAIYSRKAVCLIDAMTGRNDFKLKLSYKDKCEVARQLCQALDELHSQGYIHQDINLKNILVYRDFSGNIHAQFNDFGGKARIGSNQKLLGTMGYESPEMSFASTLTAFPFKASYKNYYKSKHNPFPCQQALQTYANITLAAHQAFLKPDPANDVWALGMSLYKLFYGKKPSMVPTFGLFSQMLCLQRKDRITARELAKIKNMASHIPATPATYRKIGVVDSPKVSPKPAEGLEELLQPAPQPILSQYMETLRQAYNYVTSFLPSWTTQPARLKC